MVPKVGSGNCGNRRLHGHKQSHCSGSLSSAQTDVFLESRVGRRSNDANNYQNNLADTAQTGAAGAPSKEKGTPTFWSERGCRQEVDAKPRSKWI